MKVYLGILLMVSRAVADAPPIPYASAAAAAAPASPSGASASFSPAYSSNSDEAQTAAGSYIQQYSHGPEGFNVQPGFDGYLVPSPVGHQKTTVLVPVHDGVEYVPAHGALSKLLKFVSSKGLQIIPKIGLALFAVAALFVLGCVVTTAICTFTPFCTISFLGWGIARESVRSLITEDKISATAAFVSDAINKYRELYANRRDATAHEAKH